MFLDCLKTAGKGIGDFFLIKNTSGTSGEVQGSYLQLAFQFNLFFIFFICQQSTVTASWNAATRIHLTKYINAPYYRYIKMVSIISQIDSIIINR